MHLKRLLRLASWIGGAIKHIRSSAHDLFHRTSFLLLETLCNPLVSLPRDSYAPRAEVLDLGRNYENLNAENHGESCCILISKCKQSWLDLTELAQRFTYTGSTWRSTERLLLILITYRGTGRFSGNVLRNSLVTVESNIPCVKSRSLCGTLFYDNGIHQSHLDCQTES